MIRLLTLALVLASVAATPAQTEAPKKNPPRYGIEVDFDRFPQATPKETLRSVLKAIEAKKFDYLIAQLAEPTFVDKRVKDTGGKFDVMVKETAQKFEADGESYRELRKYLTDGEWPEATGDEVEVKCEGARHKQMFFKKIGNHWFLENRTSKPKDADPPKEEK